MGIQFETDISSKLIGHFNNNNLGITTIDSISKSGSRDVGYITFIATHGSSNFKVEIWFTRFNKINIQFEENSMPFLVAEQFEIELKSFFRSLENDNN